jgi:hypothetical protein
MVDAITKINWREGDLLSLPMRACPRFRRDPS